MAPPPTADSDLGDASKKAVDFIDFGCGVGKSIGFVRMLTGGEGFGIDISEQAVSECWEAGLPAEVGDLLSYTGRNTALAVTAIDLLPEIGDRADFEQAVSRMILAARNYVLIQHNFYDADSALATHGQHVAAHFGKRLRFKPTVADYITLMFRLAPSHSICGIACFGVGEPRLVPLSVNEVPLTTPEARPTPVAYRNLRVVIGRKEVGRFRSALRRARTGQQLFLWERPEAAA